MKKLIKSYSYSLWNDILEIFIVDENDNEFVLATNCYCTENDVEEIIEQNGYFLGE